MRVVIAMSGGVDSSVGALLLREQGHDVTGVFLRNGVSAGPGRAQGCCSARDACDAEEVAGLLGIPFYSLDQAAEFRRIIDSFVADYAAGRTPNPCVECNRQVKMGELLRFARSLGADAVASGHYARCRPTPDGVELLRGVDVAKDQSYVLSTVPAPALGRTLFPCGELTKGEIRERAVAAGLPVHAKAESQEICFVPTGDYRDLLRAEAPELLRPGDIVDREGTVLGRHEGFAAFTVGQRRGLQLGAAGPAYVQRTDPARNQVVVGPREQAAVRSLCLEEVNWLVPPAADGLQEGLLQVRAHHPPVAARARWEHADPAQVEVALDTAVIAAPGQIGAFYAGEQVLFAGRLRPYPSPLQPPCTAGR